MVEDLARWKAALCQRTTELQEIIKRLLEEHNIIRDTSLKTYRYILQVLLYNIYDFTKLISNLYLNRILTILREKFDSIGTTSGKKHKLASTNIVDLAQGCCQLTELLRVNLLCGIPDSELQKKLNISGLDMKTVAENNAEKVELFNF